MRFSEAKGRKVVSISDAQTVAKVAGFVVDPGSRSVVAVHVKKAEGGDTLHWSDLTAFGADAVTVSGPEVIGEPDEQVAALHGKEHEVLGKRVLSAAGEELGSVKDVEFDPATGALTALDLGKEDRVEGRRLVGIGSYAVVVATD